ncbi:hypothetical protein NDU88_002895 [Pleurodeles waltl]|uniref:Uncharacterized protein n=1 Tax=Pleurodeles waltl TaxID=8319 RepID=A0AAV7NF46_PLEWA|nr:hypothetical protein NDU88_002895 [Pleurodeles waltl]
MTGAGTGIWCRLTPQRHFKEKEVGGILAPSLDRLATYRAQIYLPNVLRIVPAWRRGKLQFFDHPEEDWRSLEMWDKVGPGPSGRSGVGSARTSGVDGMDWRRHGDCLLRGAVQRCDNSVSRIEIQQDDTMLVAEDPKQAVKLADLSYGELRCFLLILEYVGLWWILLLLSCRGSCVRLAEHASHDWEQWKCYRFWFKGASYTFVFYVLGENMLILDYDWLGR